MIVTPLQIADVKCLTVPRHEDERGYLAETLHRQRLQEAGVPDLFAQENQSFSERTGTVRGLHAQKPPFAQAKLVRVLRGRIFDVAIDVRPASPTYGQAASIVLSHDDLTHIYVPAGFLHGFCTLEDATVVLYKTTAFFAPGSELGVVWNDPDLGISWPVETGMAIVSDKDRKLGRLKDFPQLDWS